MVRIYIHFTFSWHLVHGVLAGLIFIFLGMVFNYFWSTLLPLSIVLYLFSAFCICYFVPVFPFIFRKHYDKSLQKFIMVQLKEFQNYRLFYTTYIPNSIFDINKEKIYFLADGYYFYLIEDFLLSEEYLSLGQRKLFKYPDTQSLNKMYVNFKLSDIVSYQCNVKQDIKDSSLNDLTSKVPHGDLYCKICLKNFKIFSIGAEVAEYFRSIIPEKEIY